MQNNVIWVKRQFEFKLPVEHFPLVVERLRGTPARLEEKLRGMSGEILTHKKGDAWSVQEQVGHLMDVELLWDGRVEDFLEGKKELRPADITNSVTKYAHHNEASLAGLLKGFRERRERLVGRLEKFGVEGAGQTAHHPRLDKPMRVIDLAFFAAEHDDHHLAKLTGMLEAEA